MPVSPAYRPDAQFEKLGGEFADAVTAVGKPTVAVVAMGRP